MATDRYIPEGDRQALDCEIERLTADLEIHPAVSLRDPYNVQGLRRTDERLRRLWKCQAARERCDRDQSKE